MRAFEAELSARLDKVEARIAVLEGQPLGELIEVEPLVFEDARVADLAERLAKLETAAATPPAVETTPAA